MKIKAKQLDIRKKIVPIRISKVKIKRTIQGCIDFERQQALHESKIIAQKPL